MFSKIDVIEILLGLPAILFALSIHEFAHAYAATKLGDDTPEKYGRLSINPLAHIDPIGFVFLLFLHFGWAKPVLIDPGAFKKPRRDEIIVSLAGPFSNLVFAFVFGGVLRLFMQFGQKLFMIENVGEPLLIMLMSFIIINAGLVIFNLLPIPPLDGSHLISVLIPDKYFTIKAAIFKYGSIVLFGLIMAGILLHKNLIPIGWVINVLVRYILVLFGIH